MSVEKFISWSDVKEMLDAGVFTREDLEESLQAIGVMNGELKFDQFLSLIKRLDDIAILSSRKNANDNDEQNVKNDIEVLPNGKGFGKKVTAHPLAAQGNEKDVDSLNPSKTKLDEVLNELYDELKGSDPELSIQSFLEWEDLLEMRELELIDDQIIEDIFKKSGVHGSNYMNLEQFVSVITRLDDVATAISDSEEDYTLPGKGDIDVPKSVRGEQKLNLEAFDLRDIYHKFGEVVTAESIKGWEYLVELMKEDIVDESTIEALINAAGIDSSTDVSFELFSEFVRLLKDSLDVVAANSSKSDSESELLKEIENVHEGAEIFQDEEGVSALTDEEFDEMAQEIFTTLKGKSKKVSMKKFLAWEDLKDMIDDGLVSKEQIELFATQIGASDYLTFDQFKQIFNKIDEVTSDLDYQDNNTVASLDDQAKTSDSLEISEIYDELKRGSKLTIEEFMNWEDVTDIINLGIVKRESILRMLHDVGAEKDLTLNQFIQLFQLIENSMRDANEGVGDLIEKNDERVDDQLDVGREDEDEPSSEELDKMAQEIFDSLKGKRKSVVTTKKLMKWEGISDAIAEGIVTKKEVQRILAKYDVENTGEYTFDRFKLIMDDIEELIDTGADDDDGNDYISGQSLLDSNTDKGFGKNVDMKSRDFDYGTPSNEEDQITRGIFDDLKGKDQFLSVQTFKEWDDMADLVEKGSIKRSTLERAIVKVGAYENGKLTYEQFIKLIDIIMDSVDPSQLPLMDEDDADEIVKNNIHSSSSKEAPHGSLEEDEDVLDEETAKNIFNELRGGQSEVSIDSFLQWDDIQVLLDSKALSSEKLAVCIENVGIEVDETGRAAKNLDFSMFYDLLQLIDTCIDQSKLSQDDVRQEDIENQDVDDFTLIERLEDSMNGDEFVGNLKSTSHDFDDKNLIEDHVEKDTEILEMFQEISKGKDTITTKQLMKWDEIQDLISSDLVSKEVIHNYIQKLNLSRDKKLNLDKFTEFIKMLDNVLVDEDGNLAENSSISLDEMEFHDEDENNDAKHQ